jgi:methionine-rich copper-binding protein CopC
VNTRRLVALLLLGLLLVTASPAAGTSWAKDDFLDSSDPAPRQQLNRIPGWVTLVFKAPADASLATIVVLDASGKNVTTGPLIVEGNNVTSQLKSGLPKGTYSVYYRTTDEFGERRGGAFQFAYGKGEWTPLESEVWQGESAQPTILNDPKPTPTATPTPTETVTPTPTGQPTSTGPTAEPTASATPRPTTDTGAPLGLLIGAGAVVLVAVAGTSWYLWRVRRRP